VPARLSIRSDLLAPLAALGTVQQGPAVYYRELRRSTDPYLVVAAWCALLDGKLVGIKDWPELIALCAQGAVRRRAFAYFEELMEHRLAREAAERGPATIGDAERGIMLAELDHDPGKVAALQGEMYLATGDFGYLVKASAAAERAGGWRASLAWALRHVVATPRNPTPLQRLFWLLQNSGQPELLQETFDLFAARNLHLQVIQVFAAAAALLRGDPERCLDRLRPLDDARIMATPTLLPYLGEVRALRAGAEERLGHYRASYAAYQGLNEAERAKNVDPQDFARGVAVRAKLPIPSLPSDERMAVVQMLGFPRSGTTLLENVLAAHPDIETFEEVPALNAAIDRIERVLLKKLPPEPPDVTYAAARERYLEELAEYRRKPEAQVLIDKMPIRTADTEFVAKLFPEWRYIFSIRHPYDVVLSCFKQRFTPNPAMENFRTIDDAVRLYDLSMGEWFKRHTMDDPGVHYVRYDRLVTDFEPVTRGVLDFVGVPWNDAVRDFARSAESRAVKTPSYQKVRQGLGIGVQTQWRNYRFAFQGEADETLRKWAEFFGYEVD
jgi:hypothetical protein